MPPVGFEPTISADEWPQTYILDRAATGSVLEKGKFLAPRRFELRKVQPAASHYTDCDILAPSVAVYKNGINLFIYLRTLSVSQTI